MTEPVWNVFDLLHDLRERALRSGFPIIDLGQGTPVDLTPVIVQRALAAAANAPGYPPAHGTEELRGSYSDWLHRRWGTALDPADVIVTAGSKELIATLPWLLGLGEDDLVVVPELAYPTYRAGAAFVGAQVLAADSLTAVGPRRVALLWLNTPSNPTGKVLPVEHLAKVVAWARERDALVVSDECYVELGEPGALAPSILAPEVLGNDFRNVLAVHSMSKRSSMAGYRVGFVSGDPTVVQRLLKRRRDAGLLAASPVQAAARVALDDDEHIRAAQELYGRRRRILREALKSAHFRIDDSQAGLFVWATAGERDDVTAGRLADRGVLVAPGGFYGEPGRDHVRFSLTAAPEQLAEVGRRLSP